MYDEVFWLRDFVFVLVVFVNVMFFEGLVLVDDDVNVFFEVLFGSLFGIFVFVIFFFVGFGLGVGVVYVCVSDVEFFLFCVGEWIFGVVDDVFFVLWIVDIDVFFD